MTETMKLHTAFLKGKKRLTRSDWTECAHVELRTIYVSKGKAGGVRFGSRPQLGGIVMRDESGEKKVSKSDLDDDGWVEWEPDSDVGDLAERFGWETYEP